MNRSPASNRLAAALCILCGAFPIGIAMGLVPVAPGTLHAPRSIIILAGLLFWLAALSMLLGTSHPRVNGLLGALLFATFALVGGWVAAFGTSSAFGGGILLLPHATGEWIARGMFGAGAVLSAVASIYSIGRVLRSPRLDA
jgi:hypothetical protein